MSTTPQPTRIHLVLGTVAFAVFLGLVVLDAHPRYSVSFYLSVLLVVSYLVLLGFGVVVTRLAEVKYGSPRDESPAEADQSND